MSEKKRHGLRSVPRDTSLDNLRQLNNIIGCAFIFYAFLFFLAIIKIFIDAI